MLLGSTCAVCRRAPGPVCRSCEAELEPATPTVPPLGIDAWAVLLHYDPGAGAVLTGLKNGQRRDLVAWAADRLAARSSPPQGLVVTWAPTAGARRRTRGFDQAELLARALARRWRLPCRPLLHRVPGPAQAGRARAQRWEHPGFRARGPAAPRVLVVDDVSTTGATLTAAARSLRAAGTAEVRAAVVARASAARSWRP